MNNGHVGSDGSVVVRVYEGNPEEGTLIAPDLTIPPIDGCATKVKVEITWRNVSPGLHFLYIVVDPANNISEANEMDNVHSVPVLIASYRQWLPMVSRSER